MVDRAITRQIQVEVQSRFVPEKSNGERSQYFFAYQIRISNLGEAPVQLLSRHWLITDGNGRVEDVKGPGVIGQQPWIQPQSSFEYESFCPLSTPTGSMKGSYQMVTESGENFSIEIPQFFLVEPGSFH